MATHSKSRRRYEAVTQNKADGATYTPKKLADVVASQMISQARPCVPNQPLRVLDPAVGDGELLLSLLQQLDDATLQRVEVFGFDTNQSALNLAVSRLRQRFPQVAVDFSHENFLEHVLEHFKADDPASLFRIEPQTTFDFIIANPPYVRTQIMGTDQAQLLARQFGLSGRVDLYHAFLIGMAQVMRPGRSRGLSSRTDS